MRYYTAEASLLSKIAHRIE